MTQRPPATLDYPYTSESFLRLLGDTGHQLGTIDGRTVCLGSHYALFLDADFHLPPLHRIAIDIVRRYLRHDAKASLIEAPVWHDLAEQRPLLWRYGPATSFKPIAIGPQLRNVPLALLQKLSLFHRPEILAAPPTGAPLYARFRGGSAVIIPPAFATNRTPAFRLWGRLNLHRL